MAAIVYKSGSPPWRQGGRTIETFRGGLLKVTDTYKTPTSDISASLATLPEGTALNEIYQSYDYDQAWIYPAPQWQDNGDGFSTISVTAYGRTTAEGVVEELMQLSELVTTTQQGDGTIVSTVTDTVLASVFTVKFTRRSGETSYLPDLSALEPRAINTDGTYVPFLGSTRNISFSSVAYYGYFTEVTLTVGFSLTQTVMVPNP